MNREHYNYPRTMLQAWPCHYPESISHYRQPLSERVASVLLAVCIGGGLALALVHWWSA